jgi:hypothetical protein
MQAPLAGDQRRPAAARAFASEGFRPCSGKVKSLRGEDIVRFLAKVDVQGPLMPGMRTRCHVWLGHKDKDGYGQFWLSGTNRRATFAALLLKGVVLKQGQQALHRCDNPSCVRLTHLRAGTSLQNVADRVRKGRTAQGASHWTRTRPSSVARGSGHPRAKFTEDEVREFRERAAAGESLRAMARGKDVAPIVMRRLVKGITWSHVR